MDKTSRPDSTSKASRWAVPSATSGLALLHYVQWRNAMAAAAHRKRVETWIVDMDRIVRAQAPYRVRVS
jgi:hypothetical protein